MFWKPILPSQPFTKSLRSSCTRQPSRPFVITKGLLGCLVQLLLRLFVKGCDGRIGFQNIVNHRFTFVGQQQAYIYIDNFQAEAMYCPNNWLPQVRGSTYSCFYFFLKLFSNDTIEGNDQNPLAWRIKAIRMKNALDTSHKSKGLASSWSGFDANYFGVIVDYW